MRSGRRSPVLAFVSATLFAVLGAGPVLADTELGHTGTVGFHELRDGRNGGAICRYDELFPSPSNFQYEAELDWIDVRPPKMKAAAGSQRVGWRFIVERRDYLRPELTDWFVVYRSSVQQAVTNTTTNAAFTTMGVRPNVPADRFEELPIASFRVQVKMFWYGDGQIIEGTATHLVDRYKAIYPTDDLTARTVSLERSQCVGWQAFAT